MSNLIFLNFEFFLLYLDSLEWDLKRQVWLKAFRELQFFCKLFFFSYQTIYFLALVCLLCHGLCVGHVMPCSCRLDLATSVLLKSQRVGAVGIFFPSFLGFRCAMSYHAGPVILSILY